MHRNRTVRLDGFLPCMVKLFIENHSGSKIQSADSHAEGLLSQWWHGKKGAIIISGISYRVRIHTCHLLSNGRSPRSHKTDYRLREWSGPQT